MRRRLFALALAASAGTAAAATFPLTVDQFVALRRILPAGNAALETILSADPSSEDALGATLRDSPRKIEPLLERMYDALLLVHDAAIPEKERAALLRALNRRYSAFLDRLANRARLPASERSRVERVRDGFVRSMATVETLELHRKTADSLKRLETDVQAALTPSTPPPAPVREEWRIEEAVDPSLRAAPTGRPMRIETRADDLEKSVQTLRSDFDVARLSPESAAMLPYGAHVADKLREALANFAREALDLIRSHYSELDRLSSVSLPRGFSDPFSLRRKPPTSLWTPDAGNLKLAVEGDRVLLTAEFETDIRNEEAVRAIQASIEDYWRGPFEGEGRPMTFATRVRVRVLGPGESFAPGALRLVDGGPGTVSYAQPNAIVFGRDLRYAAAAHEFGHVLGLPDEYEEGFVPGTKTAVNIQYEGNLMSSLNGGVLPKHLLAAYQALRSAATERPSS